MEQQKPRCQPGDYTCHARFTAVPKPFGNVAQQFRNPHSYPVHQTPAVSPSCSGQIRMISSISFSIFQIFQRNYPAFRTFSDFSYPVIDPAPDVDRRPHQMQLIRLELHFIALLLLRFLQHNDNPARFPLTLCGSNHPLPSHPVNILSAFSYFLRKLLRYLSGSTSTSLHMF